MGIFSSASRPLNCTAMTTAVQPSELVFEFASNGMDEMNQVSCHAEENSLSVLVHTTGLALHTCFGCSNNLQTRNLFIFFNPRDQVRAFNSFPNKLV